MGSAGEDSQANGAKPESAPSAHPRWDSKIRTMTPNKYFIELLSNGKVDIARNTRAWRYDLDDLDEALSAVRKAEGKGVEVLVVGPDGGRSKTKT